MIWQRRQTLEEFAAYAETFAREHGEPGTLSVRHLKRLVAGMDPHGKPVATPRQVTTRLLERIFDTSIDDLLSAPPSAVAADTDEERELRDRLRTSARIDATTLDLIQDQLTGIRRLDRQFGAAVAYREVLTKADQVSKLLNYSLTSSNRRRLAESLSELSALAGWQALDTGHPTEAWQHYERGKAAAAECDSAAHLARATGEQAFVLIDLDEPASAAELLTAANERAARNTPALLRAWLAAAKGEALAAIGRRDDSLLAFDRAASLLPTQPASDERPYVGLDSTHLARWRGHALARMGDPTAVEVLTSALHSLDPSYTRAETALRVDLGTAFTTADEAGQAQVHLARAETLAAEIGSARQRSRLHAPRPSRDRPSTTDY